MTKFQVTLHFSFDRHQSDDETEYESNKTSKRKQRAAFKRTDKYYEEHDIIDYIKSNDAMSMVEYVVTDGEVLSAEWDESAFAIRMDVYTDGTADELREDLLMNSLEDGEYETCGESPWVLFTRNKDGEPFEGSMDMEDVWEYGLVDYRRNPIEIVEKD